MPSQTAVVERETFGPLLYVLTYSEQDEAIALQNGVPQGLASSIFTTDLREAELFLAAAAPIAASPTSTSAERCRDRWCVRRREGNGGRARVGIRCLEGLHAAPDRDGQLHGRPSARSGIVFDLP